MAAKKFDNPEAMEAAIGVYFSICDERGVPYTIEGLCAELEVTRQTLLNYEKLEGYEAFFDTVKRAKRKVEANMVEQALLGKYQSAVSIFLMKNNMGYSNDPKPLDSDSSSNGREEILKRNLELARQQIRGSEEHEETKQ